MSFYKINFTDKIEQPQALGESGSRQTIEFDGTMKDAFLAASDQAENLLEKGWKIVHYWLEDLTKI